MRLGNGGRYGRAVSVLSTAVFLGGCSIISGSPPDGFAAFGPCMSSEGETCIMVWHVSQAARYEITILEQNSTEVRIRVNALGTKTEDDMVNGLQVFLEAPIGDRAVINDTSGEAVPFENLTNNE